MKSFFSIFRFQIVDTDEKCLNTKMYIADVTGFAILVYDFTQNKSWRIENQLFRNTPGFENFTIAGESFQLADGIFGMALRKRSRERTARYSPFISTSNTNKDNRQLYFHSLASNFENSVLLSVLNQGKIFESNPNAFPQDFQAIGNR